MRRGGVEGRAYACPGIWVWVQGPQNLQTLIPLSIRPSLRRLRAVVRSQLLGQIVSPPFPSPLPQLGVVRAHLPYQPVSLPFPSPCSWGWCDPHCLSACPFPPLLPPHNWLCCFYRYDQSVFFLTPLPPAAGRGAILTAYQLAPSLLCSPPTAGCAASIVIINLSSFQLPFPPAAGCGASSSASPTCPSPLPLPLQLGVGVWPAGRPGPTRRMAPLRRLLLRFRLSRLTHP